MTTDKGLLQLAALKRARLMRKAVALYQAAKPFREQSAELAKALAAFDAVDAPDETEFLKKQTGGN